MTGAYSLTERLAKHLLRPVDGATRARARLHLLDWLACVAGARAGALARRLGPTPLRDKAAALGNLLEMDDVHRVAVLHPGPVLWPLLVGAEGSLEVRPDGGLDASLDAVVRGYEAMIAVGATFDAHHYAHYHPTATAGLFGAAAAAAALGGLDADGVANAMALAGSVSGGLWQMRHAPGDAKQWHVVHALRAGEQAAWLAGRGLVGPRAILEGPQGLHAATCREPRPMAFADGWRIHEVSFKPWAACRHAHPAIDCALTLRAAGKLAAPFHVETYADAIAFCDRPHPATEAEAKFSLQHAVAVVAAGREATPADFTPDAIAALAPLRAQVTVAEDPAITARYPAHFGARLNGLELADARGDPERPVDEAAIIAKMHMLADWGGLPGGQAGRAVDLALRGGDAGAIGRMVGGWLA